jgi:hypothetical protein
MSNIYLFIPLVITLVRTLFTLRMRKVNGRVGGLI